jgi:uncharacterized membrane protein
MRSSVLWFLLAASLALNVFFAAGLVWPQLMGEPQPPQERDVVSEATEAFALDERQVAALEEMRQQLAERREARRGERDRFRALIIDALRRPEFDRASLSQAIEQRREGSGGLILDVTEDVHGFLAGLTPDQKAAFLERAEREHDFLRRLLFPPRSRSGGDGRPSH